MPLEDPQRPTFPKWTLNERDYWMDLFQELAVGMVMSRMERSTLGTVPASALIDNITIAAQLTDHAIQDMQYRFWIQQKAKKKVKRAVKQPAAKRKVKAKR